MTRHVSPSLAAVLACALAACGGGDNTVLGAGGGTVTIASASPATHNGVVDLASAQARGNEAKVADATITVPYCSVVFERARHAGNGALYTLTVNFRQSDAKVVQATLAAVAGGWTVGQLDLSGAMTGVTVDTAARTVSFSSRVLGAASPSTQTATVTGTFGFDRNTSVAACGA